MFFGPNKTCLWAVDGTQSQKHSQICSKGSELKEALDLKDQAGLGGCGRGGNVLINEGAGIIAYVPGTE